jgi:hypothetical protein
MMLLFSFSNVSLIALYVFQEMAEISEKTRANVLLVEPFYAGSHKQLIDLLHQELLGMQMMEGEELRVQLVTMTGKKWHWRARTSGLYLSQNIPQEAYTCVSIFFCLQRPSSIIH